MISTTTIKVKDNYWNDRTT